MSRDNENGKYIFPMCHGGHHVHLQTGRNGYALTCRLMVIAAGGREDDKIHAKMQFRNVSSNERVPTRMALNFKGHSAVISVCMTI